MTDRKRDLAWFYQVLEKLEKRHGGRRFLTKCDGRMDWPDRGIYFFFENGQERVDSGRGNRVVRIGTHALKRGSKTTLWNRLSQHRGVHRSGGGNHRGSVFRLHIGTSFLSRDPTLKCSSWGQGSSAPSEIREREQYLEAMVSEAICGMPFLWLGIADPAGPDSDRGYIERNAIALLSNFNKHPLDAPTSAWLGLQCASKRVRESGLWNSNHVDERYDDGFISRFDELVSTGGCS